MTASYRRSRKISAVCSMRRPSTRGTILSMLDGSRINFLSIYWICGSNTLCSASSARQPEIFGGTNFRGNKFLRAGVWSRKSWKFLPRENFPLYGIPMFPLHTLVLLKRRCYARRARVTWWLLNWISWQQIYKGEQQYSTLMSTISETKPLWN